MAAKGQNFKKDIQYYKFCLYGFLKNLRLFEPFLILFFIDTGLTFLQIGVLYSIREIARNILEIPAGIIADSIGRKKTMVSSFAFYIVSFAVFYLFRNFGIFVFAMLLYAVGDAFRTGTHKAMIFDYLKLKGWQNQKVYYYGHTRSWSQFGSAVSALLAGLLVFYTDSYRMIFIFSTIPYFLDLINIASYPNELNGSVMTYKKGEIIKNFKKVILDFFYSFKNKILLKAIVNLSVFTGYYKAMKDYLQPVLKTFALSLPVLVAFGDKQRSSVVIAVVYFFIYLLTSFSARNSGRFSERFKNLYKPLNLTLIAGAGAGLLTGIFYEMNIMLLSIIFFIAIYLFENLRKPIGISYVAENIDTDIMATVLSAESQAHTIVAAIAAPLVGWLADSVGLGYSILIVSAGLILISPLYLLRKTKVQVDNS
jgi:MFS family permease